jgi:hypothetical protein
MSTEPTDEDFRIANCESALAALRQLTEAKETKL